MRLQKFLSQAGVASRRGAEALIQAGRVEVNGRAATVLGTRIDPGTDQVRVDGRLVQLRIAEWIALHKPPGYVSTRHDPQRRPTIYDLLPRDLMRLFSVGRLDADSEGLILLTNDGDAAYRLLHPRYGAEREYEVQVAGAVTAGVMETLLAGVELEDGPARALRVARLGPNRLRLTLAEGRKREVRRMLAAVGHPVLRLCRTRFGSVLLGALPPGGWRRLEVSEYPPPGPAGPAGLT